MAPNAYLQLSQDIPQPCDQNFKVEKNINCEEFAQSMAMVISARKMKSIIYTCRKEEHVVSIEREAMIRQQNAKARGEKAILRRLQSKAAEHKEKAVELEILADLLSLRATELLDQCNTSSSDQDILRCDNLMSSISALGRMSEHNKIVSQEIMSESKERGIKEELRQMQVKEAVRDFNKYGQGSSRRTCVSGVNIITRAALRNRLEINALNQEV